MTLHDAVILLLIVMSGAAGCGIRVGIDIERERAARKKRELAQVLLNKGSTR